MPTGSCLCHIVKYQYDGEPSAKAVCHCLTCHKLSSGSSANLLIPNTNFRVTSGFPKTYSMTHESGMKLTTHFCENCGSLLYKVGDREEFKGAVIVLAGTLDDEEEFEKAKPEAEFFVKHRVGWWPELGDAMQLGEFS
ncbi:Mss4-like protein [Aspergillus alliaceus]|uniref:Mss4-like protein n=1 Tax=Petromyces alliaceus TaxID=209559 RepID=A0A5N7BVC0_PETAA|nr:Mss4-like protein [Aspergillus alliaceus]KAB8228004.1 Mss4-like protein [Aspergillus alliaceus]KAE8385538.1 Mss4-like protein [Aspergillus alliaceus]